MTKDITFKEAIERHGECIQAALRAVDRIEVLERLGVDTSEAHELLDKAMALIAEVEASLFETVKEFQEREVKDEKKYNDYGS